MSPFEYLSVLISIIVGLAVSHLLTAVARLIQRRHHMRMYLPTLLWIPTLFIVQIQIWWVAYTDRLTKVWNFFTFLFSLVIPVLAYIMCTLVVPDMERDEINLRESYHENRAWFFGIIVAAWLVSFVEEIASSGGITVNANTGFRLIMMSFSLLAIFVRRDEFHVANAVLSLALFSTYVFAEFLRLR